MTKETTSAFDAADYLKTSEDQAAFLAAALEDYDPAHFRRALNAVARAQGMSEIADMAGVSRQGLYKALSEDGDPRLSTLVGVLKALGIKMTLEAA
ncbi:MAG: addiction module antidote protein [Pseudomonadota bacterium]